MLPLVMLQQRLPALVYQCWHYPLPTESKVSTWTRRGAVCHCCGALRGHDQRSLRMLQVGCVLPMKARVAPGSCPAAPMLLQKRTPGCAACCSGLWRPPTLTVLAAAGDIKQPFSYMLRQDGTGTPVLSLDTALIRRCYADEELKDVWAEHNTSGRSATAAGGACIWGTRPTRQLRSYAAQAVLHRVLDGRACGGPDGRQQRRCPPATQEPEGKRR